MIFLPTSFVGSAFDSCPHLTSSQRSLHPPPSQKRILCNQVYTLHVYHYARTINTFRGEDNRRRVHHYSGATEIKPKNYDISVCGIGAIDSVRLLLEPLLESDRHRDAYSSNWRINSRLGQTTSRLFRTAAIASRAFNGLFSFAAKEMRYAATTEGLLLIPIAQ